MHRTATIALGTLMVIALGGCGQVTEKVAEQAAEQVLSSAGADVNIDEGKVTVTGPSGQAMAVGENVALPDNWPAAVPVAQGTLAMATVDEASKTAGALWMVEGSAKDALTAYRGELESAGFTVTTESNTGESSIVSAEGNGLRVDVISADSGDQHSLTVGVSPLQ